MNADWTLVFEISRWSNGLLGDLLFRLTIGLAVLGSVLTGLWRMWVRRDDDDGPGWKHLPMLIFLGAWSIFWIVMHQFPSQIRRINTLVGYYRHGTCERLEGTVSVLREQSVYGRGPGDKLRIGEQEFVIDYFRATAGYRETLSHGGALKNGVQARVCHHDGVLLKVEVRPGPAPAAG